MGDNMLKQAMQAVMKDMGRAARDGRAKRFMGPGKRAELEVTVGGAAEPASPGADVEVDPVMAPEELEELQGSLPGQG